MLGLHGDVLVERRVVMRVQVNVSDDLVKQLDEYANAVGLSRSALCGYFIGQGMFSLQKGLEMASSAIQSYAMAVGNAVADDNNIAGQMKLTPNGDMIEER